MSISPPPPSPAPPKQSTEFRFDINALRAVAVVSVLLFHFDVMYFDGGYLGVDIFFVISGFLMTNIIVNGLGSGSFGMTRFYAARARRILPALLVMLVAVSALSLVLLDPVTSADIGLNAFVSALFLSNFLYATQDSYFAAASESNWLLHTWTLSVEWQFYLLYPVALLLARRSAWIWRRRLPLMLVSTVAIFLISIGLAAYSRQAMYYAFFLLPTRSWELLAGGCVALAATYRPSGRLRDALEFGGLAIVIGAVFAMSRTTPWPSVWTALPVIGTAAVLWAAPERPGWARPRVVQWLGLWSYSIYLWHWPVVAAMSYWDIDFNAAGIAMGIALSLVLGIGSFYLIENPARHFLQRASEHRARQIMVGAAFAGISGLFATLFLAHGFYDIRMRGLDASTRSVVEDYLAASGDWNGGANCTGAVKDFHAGKSCRLGSTEGPQMAVIGDSHAQQFIPRFAELVKNAGVGGITVFYQSGCPPIPAIDRVTPGYRCPAFSKAAFERVQKGNYSAVIIMSAWSVYLPGNVRDLNGTKTVICAMHDAECRRAASPEEFSAMMAGPTATLTRNLATLTGKGTQVSIVLPYPISTPQSANMLYRTSYQHRMAQQVPGITRTAYLDRTSLIRSFLSGVAEASGAQLIDPTATLCDENCSMYVGSHFMFTDSHHIRTSLITDDAFSYVDGAVARGLNLERAMLKN